METTDLQAAAQIETTEAASIKAIELDDAQVKAIELCCNPTNRVVCVTGPAGSGKTTIMREAYKLLTGAGHNVALAAPTGKAAKRIYEATNIRARTIHMLLEYTHPGDPDPKTGKPIGVSVPRRWQSNPLSENIVIVDEYAMVNRELHRSLVQALPHGGRLLVFGDINQLPPIEPNKVEAALGQPFKMLMEKFPTVVLDKIHRHGAGSGIVENARRILKAMSPMRKDDFDIVVTDDPIKIVGMLVRKIEERHGVTFRQLDAQVIAPRKGTWCGSDALNGMMQQIYERKENDAIELARPSWDKKSASVSVRVGTKVIQVKNDYVLGIYNGETGIVTEINQELGTIVVDWGDRAIEIPPELEYDSYDNVNETRARKFYNPQMNVELAYALTTHKCQGSEYSHVVYVMNKSMFALQIRPNFYTGVTRARNHVTVVTDARSMTNALVRTETKF